SVDKDMGNENTAHLEEQQYGTRLRLLNNDGSRDNLLLLTGIKELFATALPHMPAQYIARVVYDRNHYSLAIVRDPIKVVGGICYRPFLEKSFIEIVFFAVDSDQQVKGYGTKLMNYFKDYIKDTFNITQFMVYADDFAVGFFRKNGFTDEITLDQDIWAQTCKPPIIYRGLECFKNGVKSVDPMSVPGIRISGWTPQLEKQAKDIKNMSHYVVMKEILNRLKSHPSSLPFHEPVNGDDVPDYYDIIKDPMDLSTVLKRIENNRYRSLLEFATDMQKIWNNAKIYNKSDTIFYKSAVELEGIFREAMFLKGLETDQIFHLVVKPSFQTSAETTGIPVSRPTSTTNARIATPLTDQNFGTTGFTGLTEFAQQPPNLNMPYFVPPSEHAHTGMPYIAPIHYPYRYMYPYPYMPTPQTGAQAQQPLVAQIPEPQQD
ncbi:16306_t:CDS:2, partial [Racocetra fulgida]